MMGTDSLSNRRRAVADSLSVDLFTNFPASLERCQNWRPVRGEQYLDDRKAAFSLNCDLSTSDRMQSLRCAQYSVNSTFMPYVRVMGSMKLSQVSSFLQGPEPGGPVG